MKLEVGMYVRTKKGNIYKFETNNSMAKNGAKKYMVNCSYNIIDLIEYMDLLVIENKLKDIDNREIYLFNPVRCDGFTEFADGKHCMIINMDYIIPIENIKVYQVLTYEMFKSISYKVGDSNE